MTILASADHNIPAFLAIAAVTFLTAFYMSRLFVVAFLGEARSDHASHAHESPSVMTSSADTALDSGVYCRIPIYRFDFHQSAGT